MTLLELLIQTLDDKKANGIITIDFRHTHALIDQMVICDVSNDRLMGAIIDAFKKTCQEQGFMDYKIEGNSDSEWLLFSVDHLVVSVFLKEARERYNIERLWHDYVVE